MLFSDLRFQLHKARGIFRAVFPPRSSSRSHRKQLAYFLLTSIRSGHTAIANVKLITDSILILEYAGYAVVGIICPVHACIGYAYSFCRPDRSDAYENARSINRRIRRTRSPGGPREKMLPVYWCQNWFHTITPVVSGLQYHLYLDRPSRRSLITILVISPHTSFHRDGFRHVAPY